MDHDYSKLTERLADQLGEPWYIQSESPGSDYVAWVPLVDGRRFGISPIESDTLPGGWRWYMAVEGDNGPDHIEHQLWVGTSLNTVCARVHALMDVWGVKAAGSTVNSGPTVVGRSSDRDYDAAFHFNVDFPVPKAYVVAYGMAHFRGPDGFLWFVPDAGGDRVGEMQWDTPQNIAEFDERMTPEEDIANPYYREQMATICRLVDEAVEVSRAYSARAAKPKTAEQCRCTGH